jgi:hypothetical protein
VCGGDQHVGVEARPLPGVAIVRVRQCGALEDERLDATRVEGGQGLGELAHGDRIEQRSAAVIRNGVSHYRNDLKIICRAGGCFSSATISLR